MIIVEAALQLGYAIIQEAGLMIFIIISVNCIGNGLRDASDPYNVLERVGEYT